MLVSRKHFGGHNLHYFDSDCEAQGTGSISGRVIDGNGQPLAGIDVNAFSGACGGDWLAGSQTDASGDYVIEGVPAGAVPLRQLIPGLFGNVAIFFENDGAHRP